MKIVLQRVTQAKVEVDNKIIAKINHGLLLLVGVTTSDTEAVADYLAQKIAQLRVFSDEADLMNLSLSDTSGSVLSISQFTVYGNTQKGRRPSFAAAAKKEQAEHLYEYFNSSLKKYGIVVKTGKFGENMQVNLTNDGPVTLILEA